jgi:hypothetical protein
MTHTSIREKTMKHALFGGALFTMTILTTAPAEAG